MKTKIFLLSLLLGFSVSIFAQGSQVYESQAPAYKTAFKRNGAGWFVNLSAGAQVYNFEDDVAGGLLDRATFIPAISIGKWANPYLGFRLKGQGLTANSYIEDVSKTVFTQKNDYFNAHLDVMVNLANCFTKYSPTRLFNFTPYLGLGFAHRFDVDKSTPVPNTPFVSSKDYHRYSDAFTFNGGLQFGFRLSNRVNLDFDLGVSYFGDYFDRISHEGARGENDNIVAAMGGLTFKLGPAFEAVEPMDYALIDDLNGKINALRRENEELSKRPLSCPECPPAPAPIVKNVNYVPNVVFFRLNSSKIDANQQISIFNTANFMNNTGEKIKVVGYADKDTGTSAYNFTLSEKRARAVAKELTTKYNIPSEKITIEWKGSDEQPYPQNNWNRVVIMSAPQ